MHYTRLGNTGLKVSVAGLGCGGFSRIGQAGGKTRSESVAIVRRALDLGVNFFDTAAAYGTESILGEAIAGCDRDEIVLSTKATVGSPGDLQSPRDIVASLDRSLQDLGTEYIDVFHLHGVHPQAYDYASLELVPALLREREKGKFRFLGITEVPPEDPGHESLQRAVRAEHFQVCMIAYHMLHQSARTLIFPRTLERGMGVLIMFAVRLLFSERGRLQSVVDGLVDEGQLPAQLKGRDQPLGFMIHEGGARNLIDAAYRFCRHSRGTDVVLFGTGNPDHLESNIASILSPPLPAVDIRHLESIFGRLVGVGLDRPGERATGLCTSPSRGGK